MLKTILAAALIWKAISCIVAVLIVLALVALVRHALRGRGTARTRTFDDTVIYDPPTRASHVSGDDEEL